MGLRSSRNVQSAVNSMAYIGLRAEHLHATNMHATHFYSDDGVDIFMELARLKEELETLKSSVTNMSLVKLSDVDTTDVSDGDVLIYKSAENKWRAVELLVDSERAVIDDS